MALYIFIRCHFYGDCSGRNMGCKQNPGSSYVSPQNICGKTTQKPINIFFFFFGWGDRLVDVHAAPPSRGGYQSAGRRAGFFSCETELPPRLAVELVTRLEMLIVRHTRCHLGQRAALDSPRRCLRVIRPVGWCTAAALLLWQWLVYPSKAIAAPVMPPTWHGGLASAPGTLPRQSAQRRETGGAQQESFFFFFYYSCYWKWKTQWKFYFFFPSSWPEGTQQEQNCSDALGNQCTVHTSPHANLLNKRQELLLHPACSLVGLVSNRIVCFFFFFIKVIILIESIRRILSAVRITTVHRLARLVWQRTSLLTQPSAIYPGLGTFTRERLMERPLQAAVSVWPGCGSKTVCHWATVTTNGIDSI